MKFPDAFVWILSIRWTRPRDGWIEEESVTNPEGIVSKPYTNTNEAGKGSPHRLLNKTLCVISSDRVEEKIDLTPYHTTNHPLL
jgi:hypothetical protein